MKILAFILIIFFTSFLIVDGLDVWYGVVRFNWTKKHLLEAGILHGPQEKFQFKILPHGGSEGYLVVLVSKDGFYTYDEAVEYFVLGDRPVLNPFLSKTLKEARDFTGKFKTYQQYDNYAKNLERKYDLSAKDYSKTVTISP
ncbi:hypothetical protein [Dyadobacter sp. 3J3]|uniref:hypothetical protein n=1 Tax=Dyadobacter sp. 3J3 TaxID=2606600 RepID=UPI00135963E8|nr:hypothetical protein [Dyadobacter sp. 3J3]